MRPRFLPPELMFALVATASLGAPPADTTVAAVSPASRAASVNLADAPPLSMRARLREQLRAEYPRPAPQPPAAASHAPAGDLAPAASEPPPIFTPEALAQRAAEFEFDPDAVRMETLTVTDSYRQRSLAAVIAQQEARAAAHEHEEYLRRNFGIGVHTKKLGSAQAYAATILFVPFNVGISW